jgi:hypothetical protein
MRTILHAAAYRGANELREIGQEAAPSLPSERLQSRHFVQMSIPGRQRQIVLPGRGRDPAPLCQLGAEMKLTETTQGKHIPPLWE